MVQLLYSPWLAHMILGSFAVSIVASLKISVAFLSHSVLAASIDVSGDGVKVGPRAEISLSAHSSAAAWLTGSATVSTVAWHKVERKIEAIFDIGSIPRQARVRHLAWKDARPPRRGCRTMPAHDKSAGSEGGASNEKPTAPRLAPADPGTLGAPTQLSHYS